MSPLSAVDPLIGIGFVKCDDFQNRSRGVTALDVNRPIGGRESQQKAAWSIFVVWIFLKNFTGRDRFAKFLDGNPTQNALIHGMLRVLEVARSHFGTDVVDQHDQSMLVPGIATSNESLWTCVKSASL